MISIDNNGNVFYGARSVARRIDSKGIHSLKSERYFIMKRKKIINSIIFILLCFQFSLSVEITETPRIGIVISKISFQHRWGVTQMSAHGWSAVANLAGLPYDCLFLSELPELNLSHYKALVFGQCTYIPVKLYPKLISSIVSYLSNGGNIIIDGPIAMSDENAKDLDHSQLDELLGINYGGFQGDSDFRIKIQKEDHYISRIFKRGQFMTQHLVNGLNILSFKEGGEVLLSSSDEINTYPFLSCMENSRNRLILVSDFSTWAGIASFFRNNQPQVFYANQIFNILIRALHWAVYGDMNIPFPVPQLSNAPLTAIIRLDADASGNLDSQIKTIHYLVDIARQTGVVPVYAWVSSQATKAGWQDLAPLGNLIEEIGGEIATHSHFHHIDREMNEKRWQEELDGSIREIEFNMNDYGYPIGKVEFFINPGNTIYMDNYEEIAKRFSFYMTHGFEQDMPLGYGNLTWYTGSHNNLVVLENTSSPDYQWFYDPTWSYTTQQITAYEEAIFDHMIRNIGRGVIFNQMWHDYSITSQPQYGKERIINKNNMAMYDAIKTKFAVNDIYCPTPVDLTNKLRSMAQWDYHWKCDGKTMEITLDYSATRLDTLPYFAGGMAVHIENCDKIIQNVIINGKEHLAYSETDIILPNLQKGKNHIEVTMGTDLNYTPRLVYISKPMPSIENTTEGLKVATLTRNKARMRFLADKGYILLNVDWQYRDHHNNLEGYVTSNRNVILKQLRQNLMYLKLSSVRILEIIENESDITLHINPVNQQQPFIRIQTNKKPTSIILAGMKIDFTESGNDIELKLPDFQDTSELKIKF